ncbi:MAG: aldo/keto reductase family protein [Firmicutes bacterium]|nr:aldo/keto reductase family protein [Bacillota bacterium]
MEYRHLGRSGLRVSEIGLGSWLTYGGSTGRQEALACIRRAYELGVNFFDTADVYQGGEAERVLGEALRGLPRSSYVLATKAFWPVGEGPNDRGLSRKHLVESLEGSLRRLGVDYVDLFYCHRFDPETPLEETLRALEDMQRQGKVLYAGVSEWSAQQMAEALHIQRSRGWAPIVADQPHYNLLAPEIEEEILPFCAREGVGVVAYSPLAQGVLAGRYRPGERPPADSRAGRSGPAGSMARYLEPEALERAGRLARLAAEAGLSPARFALAWVLRRPEVSSALVGASRLEQVEENVSASGLRLPEELWEQARNLAAGF